MTIINSLDLASQLPAVLELVRNGESVLVTENHRSIARIGPVPETDEEDDERPWRGVFTDLPTPPPHGWKMPDAPKPPPMTAGPNLNYLPERDTDDE